MNPTSRRHGPARPGHRHQHDVASDGPVEPGHDEKAVGHDAVGIEALNRPVSHRRMLLSFIGLLALAACGSPPPPPPVLHLTINGSSDQNPDGAGRAAPVAVRVYQLSGTAKFEQTDVFALKDNEAKTLATESAAGSQEYLISPGEKKNVTIDLKPMVSSIGVAVLYRDIDHAKWRATASANAHGPTDLTATIGKLALSLR